MTHYMALALEWRVLLCGKREFETIPARDFIIRKSLDRCE